LIELPPDLGYFASKSVEMFALEQQISSICRASTSALNLPGSAHATLRSPLAPLYNFKRQFRARVQQLFLLDPDLEKVELHA